MFKRLLRLLFTRSKNVIFSDVRFILKNKNKISYHSTSRLYNYLLCCKLKNKEHVLLTVECVHYKDVITNLNISKYVLRDVNNKIHDFEDVVKFKPLDCSWSKVLI